MSAPSSAPGALEEMAVHLAHAAGAEITASLSRVVSIAYKTQGRWGRPPRDPVSETDRAIELMIRSRLALAFPRHGILGEEIDEPTAPDVERIWTLDPIDGTLNFINGLPLFASAIGVLERGRPIVGAVWCSTSHELRPGVYHAREGGPLCFEGSALRPGVPNPGVLRRVEGAPEGEDVRGHRDVRITGSAALECAFVAAGLLASARFRRVRIWDVAAGVALVRAAKGEVFQRSGRGWRPLETFEPPRRRPGGGAPGLRDWRASLVLGSPGSIEGLRSARSRGARRRALEERARS